MLSIQGLEIRYPIRRAFLTTMTPLEGKAAADGWLDILSSEGYDIIAYIEEEQAVHASQRLLTCPRGGK